jgi:phage/plasmid-like protein (TIGR03299 family)|tara:strand:- start:6424 stop:7380 length:957 start_codon:yes stop_codon:yes gene_type:complete
MAHMVETMAYAGQVPWHGLGVRVNNNLSPFEILDAAQLNWTVEKQDMISKHPTDHTLDQIVSGKKTLVRSSDNTILDIIGSDWNPVQNSEAFDFFSDFVKAGDMEMHTAGSLDDGKMVWALAKVNESFELFKGDKVDSYLLFSNPHQYGKSIDVRFTPIRVVCNNTLSLSLGQQVQNSIKLSHRVEFNPETVKDTLGFANEKLTSYKEMAQFLGSKRYTNDNVTEYFDNVFPVNFRGIGDAKKARSNSSKRASELLTTQPGAEFAAGSWWSAFNAVTYMTDHEMGRDANTRIKNAWFGPTQKVKTKALEVAVKYAEAA